MPELLPTFDALMNAIDGGDEEARFLTMYRPPPLVRGCSQLVLPTDRGPMLIRNYDHAPHLCDGVVLCSSWNGVRVMAPTDCLWGALDGVNDNGLAVALAFGGRPVVGDGFSAALVTRYVLQTCTNAKEAEQALSRVPVYMPYTFVVVDASGEHLTAYLAPDRGAQFDQTPVSTNHQGQSEWSSYVQFSRSVERLEHLRGLVGGMAPSPHAAVSAFLRPPLYRTEYARGSGTLYTAVLEPVSATAGLHWPEDRVKLEFGSFPEGELEVRLGLDHRSGDDSHASADSPTGSTSSGG
jgi:predicted choloylglycine hydrolase